MKSVVTWILKNAWNLFGAIGVAGTFYFSLMYVPDYVINAGGLMNVANELQGYNKEKAKYQVEGIYYILTRIFDYAVNNNISTLEAANILAERRIQDYIKWNHQ